MRPDRPEVEEGVQLMRARDDWQAVCGTTSPVVSVAASYYYWWFSSLV
jgi:hypothetical protein